MSLFWDEADTEGKFTKLARAPLVSLNLERMMDVEKLLERLVLI